MKTVTISTTSAASHQKDPKNPLSAPPSQTQLKIKGVPVDKWTVNNDEKESYKVLH